MVKTGATKGIRSDLGKRGDFAAVHEEREERSDEQRVTEGARANQKGETGADAALSAKDLISGELPANVPWSKVLQLMGLVGRVEHKRDDGFVFVYGGKSMDFKRPKGEDMPFYEMAELRKFLSETDAENLKGHEVRKTIVVIDHHLAHVYIQGDPGLNRDEGSAKPYDPFGFHHHLIHRKEAHYQGERVPEDEGFYRQIAEKLADSEQIIVIGHGTGKSSAAEVLVEFLRTHFSVIASHVVAVESLDLSALTGPEIDREVKRHLG
jgi:hypothetical protein